MHSSQAAAIAAEKNAKQLPVRGRAPGALELYQEKRWRQLQRVAQELRSLGDQPLSHLRAVSLAKRFGVDRSTIYRYRSRLREVDETTANAGRTRGWKPLRLFVRIRSYFVLRHQERRLYGQLLMTLNASYRPGDRLAVVEYTALMLLRKVAPRLIVVDEVHNLLAGTALEQRASLNLLKFPTTTLPCAPTMPPAYSR